MREVEVVYISRPRCPKCKSANIETRRTAGDQGDGTTLRYVRCCKCGERFKVVVE